MPSWEYQRVSSTPGQGSTFSLRSLSKPGTLAMARTADPNSNGGQFFIVYDDTQLPTQGGGYTIFGRVTDGMEIVEAVAAAGGQSDDPNGSPPAQPISILSVEVEG